MHSTIILYVFRVEEVYDKSVILDQYKKYYKCALCMRGL